MSQDITEDLEKRGISADFFFDQYVNMKRYSRNLDSIMLSSNKAEENKNELFSIIRNEETTLAKEVTLRNYGIIDHNNINQDEATSFDQIPNAMKYMQFLLSRRYPTKNDLNTKSEQPKNTNY